MDHLVTIRTYQQAELAHLDAAKLADEGIESAIHDETMASMMPHLSGALGGVKLLVRGNEAPRANEVLGQESILLETADEPQEIDQVDRCPECGSAEYSRRGSIFTIIASVLFGMSAASTLKRKECSQCGKSWL